MYYWDAKAVCVVYDVTNHESFDKAWEWIDEIRMNLNLEGIFLALVGNKIDNQDNA